jgi:hypothetical protein
VKTCGHMIHPNCLLRTVETEVEKYVDFEMICPMCRHYSNILLPSWDYSSEEFKISSVKDLMKLIRKGLNCEKTFYEFRKLLQQSVVSRTRRKDFESTVTRKVLHCTLKNVMI